MRKVTLKIKAKDILEDNYMSSAHCPITKAFARVGLGHLQDIGGMVNNAITDESVDVDKNYLKLHNKMCSMFKYLNPESCYGEIPEATEPKDFQGTFELYE